MKQPGQYAGSGLLVNGDLEGLLVTGGLAVEGFLVVGGLVVEGGLVVVWGGSVVVGSVTPKSRALMNSRAFSSMVG